MTATSDRRSVAVAYHLMQLCDSALPVGGFSFSCALESAVAQGLLRSVHDIEQYVRVVVRQSLLSDGVAALHAMRSADSIAELCRADRALMARKASVEMRTMSARMGRKLAELGSELLPCHDIDEWLSCVVQHRAEGSYAVSQGLIFSLCGASECDLFAAVGYGTASMVLGAALRLARVTHRDTQKMLFSLSLFVDSLYDQARMLGLEQMHGFAPEMDILSSLHERGIQRMFMS
ncbi:MAG: urease accessory protein UreF [Alistipes sp.]|nr:urease accessory protein UreF [Alistipes sp.]